MAARDPSAVAAAYFAAINARDPAGIRAVFAPQGKLITPAGTVIGPAAIADFYAGQAFTAPDLRAHPGPFMVSGDRLAVQIELQMHGQKTRVADFFVIRDSVIEQLAVYLGGPA